MNIDVGQIIAGKYELVRLLGRGAMGEVWLARHETLGGEFAIKLVETTDDIEAEAASGRFQLEAQIAAKLSRKTRHVVSVSDHGEEGPLAYLVMERLDGESLEARTKRGAPLSLPEVAAIVVQIARALSVAHEDGVVHRDLKPANVWLGKDEDGRLLVKLLDFGIARTSRPFRTRSPFATTKDMVLGTPSYMSPEQARGLESLDHRCDLWALAVVAYEALTQTIPFEGETVEDVFLAICTFRAVPARSRRPDLPPDVDAFFARAFTPKLDARFATAAELAEAFEALADPGALDVALGLPLVPSSARRLEAARRASDPNLAPVPSGDPVGLAPPPSPPVARSSGDGARGAPLAAAPDARPRRGGARRALAAVGALLLVGLVVAVALRGPVSVDHEAPAAPPTPVAADLPVDPPEPVAFEAVIDVALDEDPTPDPPRADPGSQAHAKPRAAPRAGAAARPASTPPPARTINKGEVF